MMIHVKSCAHSKLIASYWTWLYYVQFLRSCHRKEDLLSQLHISSDKIVVPWNVSGKQAPPRLHFRPGMCFQHSFSHSYKWINKIGPVTQQKKSPKDQQWTKFEAKERHSMLDLWLTNAYFHHSPFFPLPSHASASFVWNGKHFTQSRKFGIWKLFLSFLSEIQT